MGKSVRYIQILYKITRKMTYSRFFIFAMICQAFAIPPPHLVGKPDGASLGFRCPPSVIEEHNGKIPKFCLDIIVGDGDCFLDDMMLTKDQCIDMFGLENYRNFVLQQKIIDEQFKTHNSKN